MNKRSISITLSLLLPIVALAETAAPAAPSALASPAPEAGKPHGIKLKQLREELGLSSGQEAKIKSLFKKNKQKIKEIRTESKDEIQNTLSPAQKLKVYRMKEKNRGKIKALKESLKQEVIQP